MLMHSMSSFVLRQQHRLHGACITFIRYPTRRAPHLRKRIGCQPRRCRTLLRIGRTIRADTTQQVVVVGRRRADRAVVIRKGVSPARTRREEPFRRTAVPARLGIHGHLGGVHAVAADGADAGALVHLGAGPAGEEVDVAAGRYRRVGGELAGYGNGVADDVGHVKGRPHGGAHVAGEELDDRARVVA